MTPTDDARSPETVTPEIVTEGSGWFEQLGDRAELDVSFTAVARSRSAAVSELGRRVAGAEPALQRSGLEVRHRRLRVHHEWRDGRVVGCRAAEDLALLVTDVSALDEVLSALVGAEPTDLRGPHWVLADPAAALREAQQRAVADARVRAEGYAAALGGGLGPLRRLSEAAEHSAPMAYRTAAVESGGPDVRALGLEPEPVRVTARCTTTWALLP
ncbi:SIMPL domain-containing protein [Pseudonocardia sichuanensis]